MMRRSDMLLYETTDEPTVSAQCVSRRSAIVFALAGAGVLALVYARLTVASFTYGIVGGYFNGYENVWNDWWLREALLHLHTNPFYTTSVEYPVGVSLRYHTLTPLGGLIALPLTPLLGYVATMNLKLLAALVAAVFFAYLLARDHTDNDLAAFAGGAVYVYANWLLISFYVSAEENYLMGTALLPLYLLLALRAATYPREQRFRGRRGWWGYAVGAVGALLALCLTDWQYTLFAVLLTVLYALATLGTHAGRAQAAQVWGRFAVIGGLWAAIIFIPLVLPMIHEAQASPWLAVGDEAPAYSLPLTQFVQIGTANPGYLLLIVCVVGLVVWWRRGTSDARRVAAYWLTAAIAGCVLALGPKLKLVPGDATTGITLPYVLWTHLPVLNIGRKPQLYYAAIGSLAFGMLTALALAALLPTMRDAIARRRWRVGSLPLARVVPGVLVSALLAGTCAPFFAATTQNPAQPPLWPKFYTDVLTHDPEPYAILELPIFPGKHGVFGGTYAAYQSVHGKSRFGASLSRDHDLKNPDLLATHATLLRDFFLLDVPHATDDFRPPKGQDFLATPDYAQMGVPLLNFYHVRYIVLYLDALTDNNGTMRADSEALVRRVLGADARPVYTDARMEAYRVPDAPPLAQPVVLDTGSHGWYMAQLSPDKTPYRWADLQNNTGADLLATNLSPQTRPTRVNLTVYEYLAPREVQITLNGVVVERITLAANESRNLSLMLTLPPGLNTLTLSSPQPSVPVQTDGKSRDARLLSFGVRQVAIG